MANAEVFQQLQLGLESTQGVFVSASKLMTHVGGVWAPVVNPIEVRPGGAKFNVYASVTDLWAAVSLEGMMSYTELAYVLAGLRKVSPTGSAPNYVWTIVPTRAAADTIATYSVQIGSAALPAARWLYGFFKGFRFDIGLKECKWTGAMVGKGVPNGGVIQVNVTAGGSGYTSAPTVSFSGGGGSGAAATAVIASGAVVGIIVTNPGTGYTSAPTVSFSGGAGTGAAATAVIPTNPVADFNVTAGGSGYTSAPTVSFSGGGGSGAAATAIVSGGAVVDVVVTNGGTGYTSAPTVSFSGGGGTGAAATAILNNGTLVAANSTMDYATSLAVAPILPQHVSLKLAVNAYPTWSGVTATPWKGIRLAVDDVNDVNRMGNTSLEWTDHVQGAPKISLEVDIEESNANAPYYTSMKVGDKVFARIYADSSTANLLEAFFSGQVIGIERKVIDKVQCITVKMTGVEDSNLGNAPVKFILTNSVGAL